MSQSQLAGLPEGPDILLADLFTGLWDRIKAIKGVLHFGATVAGVIDYVWCFWAQGCTEGEE